VPVPVRVSSLVPLPVPAPVPAPVSGYHPECRALARHDIPDIS